VLAAIAVARLFRGGEFSSDLGEPPASEEAGYSNLVASVQKVVISYGASTGPNVVLGFRDFKSAEERH
jgi:hypothetical protein